MKKGQGFILVSILICASLLLAACSSGGGTPEVKTGGETPTAGAVAPAPAGAYPAQAPAAAGPTEGYPAGQPPQPPANVPTVSYPAPGDQAPTGQALSIQVVKADGTTATLAAADIQKIAATQVTIGQSDQSGYKLSDVLAAAGVTSFQEVTVSGTSGSATLTQAQVTADVILSTVDPNSLQLAGTSLAADQSVKGVSKIEVK